jgi:mannan endo-1,4-beta-mannosidase
MPKKKEDTMKRLFTILILVLSVAMLLVSCGGGGGTTTWPVTPSASTVDVNANAKTKATLNYLYNLPNNGSSNRTIIGQQTGMWDNIIPKIYSSTGKYPGFIGIDFEYSNNASDINTAIGWANMNILIGVNTTWNNPVTGSLYNPASGGTGTPGTAWDTTNVDFVQLITDGTALNTKFKTYLDALATGLLQFQNAGVTVLYRPFQEVDGAWFWWGAKDPTQFKNAWIYVFNYITVTNGLHNVLWIWCPTQDLSASALSYYPGSQYVDIIAVDKYSALPIAAITGYSNIGTAPYDKPFAIGEFAPCSPTAGCSSPVDVSNMMAGIKSNMPKTIYINEWTDTPGVNFSLAYMTGVSALFADPWVITQDDIPSLTGTTTYTVTPSAGTGGTITPGTSQVGVAFKWDCSIHCHPEFGIYRDGRRDVRGNACREYLYDEPYYFRLYGCSHIFTDLFHNSFLRRF